MKKSVLVVLACIGLAACGANGEPVTPKVSGGTSVSLNSGSGISTSTQIGIHFPSN